MPFVAPFRSYVKGDFIFGIAESIASFRNGLSPDLSESPVPTGTQRAAATLIALGRKPTTVRELSLEPANVSAKFTGDRAILNNSYLTALESHPKYHRAHDKNTESMTSVDSNSIFRAKSKAGLNYCIANGKHLHFVLDGIDLSEVISKSRSNEFKNAADDKYRNVTGAELRWIYRHRHSNDTKAYVQFWINKQPCPPPWEPGFKTHNPTAPDWSSYQPTHTM